MKPNFTRFKKDVLKLIDHTLENEIHLRHYVRAPIDCVDKMNESGTTCGAAACIKGYAPVVFPKRFKWESNGIHIVVAPRERTSFIVALAGHRYAYHLQKIFDSNNSSTSAHRLQAMDIVVVKKRKELIEESRSFKHLGELINNNIRWF